MRTAVTKNSHSEQKYSPGRTLGRPPRVLLYLRTKLHRVPRKRSPPAFAGGLKLKQSSN
jgi:hypothetical protein